MCLKKNIEIRLFIAFLSLAIFSCQGKGNDKINRDNSLREMNTLVTDNNVKQLKNLKRFVFKIDNLDYNSFGFALVENDQAISITNILILGDFIFLSDAYHGNVKRIDSDGKIISSAVLMNNTYMNLRSIGVFNNLLYVFSDKEDVFILDLNLQLKEHFKIGTDKWNGVKDILEVTVDTLTIYRSISDVKQLSDGRIQLSLIKIDKSNNITKSKLYYPDYESYSAQLFNIRGLLYKEERAGNKDYLVTPYGKFEIPEVLPNTSTYYDSKNLDFNQEIIAYFNINPQKVVITVCEY